MKTIAFSFILLLLTACVQSPTHTTNSLDDRPGIVFDLTSSKAASYELKIDGLAYGKLRQYKKGKTRLRVIEGTHLVEILNKQTVIYSEKMYLGAGIDRIIKVPAHE